MKSPLLLYHTNRLLKKRNDGEIKISRVLFREDHPLAHTIAHY
jgi:hypothetical protein